MKKILIRFSLLFIVLMSFIINLNVEKKLYEAFSKITIKDIKNLEHTSNKNYSQNGIENIGESLKAELIKMNVDECDFNVRKDGFFFFQNKSIYITNSQKCLKINTQYIFLKSEFTIKGFQTSY